MQLQSTRCHEGSSSAGYRLGRFAKTSAGSAGATALERGDVVWPATQRVRCGHNLLLPLPSCFRLGLATSGLSLAMLPPRRGVEQDGTVSPLGISADVPCTHRPSLAQSRPGSGGAAPSQRFHQ
eukprot:scaffold7428_cov248-Pinguiococcus_pyrenoidosus.AAC.6